jgi:hypothetical protein
MAGEHMSKDAVYRTRLTRENGCCESFNSKLRDEFLNGEIFYSVKELRVLAERWLVHYNTVRPHSSLGYKPPASEAWPTGIRSRGASVHAALECGTTSSLASTRRATTPQSTSPLR